MALARVCDEPSGLYVNEAQPSRSDTLRVRARERQARFDVTFSQDVHVPVRPVSEETNAISFLLSFSTVLFAIAAFYVARSLWIARREWPVCAADTKILYLLVAPPLTLAVDLLELTDRVFWRPRFAPTVPPRRPRSRVGNVYRVNPAMRTNA